MTARLHLTLLAATAALSVCAAPAFGTVEPDSVARQRELGEVVVTASRQERPLKLSPIATQVIAGKTLTDAGYAGLQQALQQETPGLNVQKVGFGSELSMQGLDARHVLFLLDGERLTGDMAGNLDFERFNLHSIDRIEIVKGASSTLYGSRATGAVINLISKRPSKPFDLRAGLRYGAPNERNFRHASPGDFNYTFERDADRPNLQAWLSAGACMGRLSSQTDVMYGSTDAFYMYQGASDRKVYTKKANPFLPHDIVVEPESARPPMGVEGSEHVTAAQKFIYQPSDALKAEVYGSAFFINSYDLVEDMTFAQGRDYTCGLKADCRLARWLNATVSLHLDNYSRFKRHELRDERQKVYDSRIFQPRLTLTSDALAGHSLILGVEHTSDRLTSDRFVSHQLATRSLTETECFLQDEWIPAPALTVSAGVRTNFSGPFGFMCMPKVAAKWTLGGTGWCLRSCYSMGYRSPSIKELFFNWDHLGMFQIRGNENLRPEHNDYVSLGAEYSSGGLFLSATTYGNFFRRKIEGVWRIYDMQYNFEYVNLRRQSVCGLEAIARWRVAKALTLRGTYSFVHVSDDDGVRLSSSSPHAATANADYLYEGRRYRINATVGASLMGAKTFDVQDRVFVEEFGSSRDAYFRCHLPAYVLLNAALTQTFRDRLRLTIGVDNITNYKPKTLGAGITMFNVPATAGARAYVQMEIVI